MKSRIATKSLNHCLCVVQLTAAPSATNAFRFAVAKPRAQAACAKIALNRFAGARVATVVRHLGRGVQVASTSGSGSVASSVASGSSRSGTDTPDLISRTSLRIRVGSTKCSGISGQGSVAETSLVIVINTPILSSRQWP